MTFKKIKKESREFHYFKLSPSMYALSDEEMDKAVAYGSFAFVAGTVRGLDPQCTIIYYERNLADPQAPAMSFMRKRGPQGVFKGGPKKKTVKTA